MRQNYLYLFYGQQNEFIACVLEIETKYDQNTSHKKVKKVAQNTYLKITNQDTEDVYEHRQLNGGLNKKKVILNKILNKVEVLRNRM